MDKNKLVRYLKNHLLGRKQKRNNMKDFRNSKSNYYVSQDNQDIERPYTVMESKTRKIITRCETRQLAESIAKFQNKTPSFGSNGFPDFLKE